MTLSDGAMLAVQAAIFACGMALLSHRFYAAYQGWSVKAFSFKSHLPGILGIALMLFAIFAASSMGWTYAIATVVSGSAVAYLYVYIFRMWVEVALLGPVLVALSILR